MDKSKNNHASNIYSPHDSAMLGYEQAKKAAEHSQFGIELDIPGTDPAVKEYFAPLLPWEICAVQAQTSNGKTLFTNFWERQIAAQLKRQGRDEIIIHVSLEESIEAMAFQDYGRILDQRPADFARGTFTDWARMQWAMSQLDGIPVWRIGDSAERPVDAPELYLSNIYRAIRELVEGRITGDKWKPAVVIVDYLQALPIDPEVKQAARDNQRRLQVAQDVFRLREMTTHLKCPIIVPLQAKQSLDGNNPPLMIPGTYDGLETSTIATRFDRILSLWMPKTSNIVGSTVSNKDGTINFQVKEDQAFLKVNKQRGGLPAGRVWELRIDYKRQEYFDTYYREAK
jgi:hypothetical protein